jgi:hypothetical protein
LIFTLFSNTLSLCSSLNVRDQVSQSWRTTGTIIFVYILIFTLLDGRHSETMIDIRKKRILFSSVSCFQLFMFPILSPCFLSSTECRGRNIKNYSKDASFTPPLLLCICYLPRVRKVLSFDNACFIHGQSFNLYI